MCPTTIYIYVSERVVGRRRKVDASVAVFLWYKKRAVL